jgi:hypothetical protein
MGLSPSPTLSLVVLAGVVLVAAFIALLPLHVSPHAQLTQLQSMHLHSLDL